MTNGIVNNVHQAIILGLGQVGDEVLTHVENRLDNVYNGVPTIRSLRLSWEEAPAGETEFSFRAGARGRLSLAADPVAVIAEHEQFVSPWLPAKVGELSDIAGTRLAGRLAFFRHIEEIQQAVRWQASRLLDSPTQQMMREKGLVVRNPATINLFVVGALDDPIGSGMFLDLAYLLARTMALQFSEGQFCQRSGIFFLPRFRMLDEEELDPMAQHEMEVIRRADAYAALKELDYYMDRQRYACRYSDALTLDEQGPPFNHACYLVDSTNEEAKGLQARDKMSVLVGEWLFQMLTSPLKDCFQAQGVHFADIRSHGKIAAYSGLGTAGLFLPIDDVIDLGSARMGLEIVNDYLLPSAPPLRDGPEAHVDVGLTSTEAANQAADDHRWPDKIVAFLDVRREAFESVYDLVRFEGLVRRRFRYHTEQVMPRMRQGMLRNVRQMADDTRRDIATRVDDIMDRTPVRGLSQALGFLDYIHAKLAQNQQETAGKATQERDKIKDINQRIEESRVRFVDALKTVEDWRPLLFMAIGALVLLVLLVYAEILILDRLELVRSFPLAPTWRYVAATIAALGTLGMIFLVGYYLWRWIQVSRSNYLSYHGQKLRTILEFHKQEAASHYFKEVQEGIAEQITELTLFRDNLETVAEQLEDIYDKPRPLFDTPRFGMEESVLAMDDPDRFYKEIAGSTLQDEITGLFHQHGPYHRWRQAPPESIVDWLRAYAAGKLAVLRETKSVEGVLHEHVAAEAARSNLKLIERQTTEQMNAPETRHAMKQRLDDLRDNCAPFLPFDQLRLDQGLNPQLMQAVGLYDSQSIGSLVNEILTEVTDVSRVTTGNRFEITAISVRHGLPLDAISALRALKVDYEAEVTRQRRPYHTRRDHLALPDLLATPRTDEEILEPMAATALGLACKVIKCDAEGKLTFSYRDEQFRETIQVNLGDDPVAASIYLQTHFEIRKLISARIDEWVVKRSMRGQEAGKVGNQAVIDYLSRYVREMSRKEGDESLESWQRAMIEEYMLRLGR